MAITFNPRHPEGTSLALLVQGDSTYGADLRRILVTVVTIDAEEHIRNNAGALDSFGFHGTLYVERDGTRRWIGWGNDTDLEYRDAGSYLSGPMIRQMSETITKAEVAMARLMAKAGPAQSVGQFAKYLASIVGAEYVVRRKPGAVTKFGSYDTGIWDVWPAAATAALVDDEADRVLNPEKYQEKAA